MRLAGLILAFVTLISPVSALAQSGEEGATLRLAFAEDLVTLDPGRLSPFDYDARDVVENLFVGLMTLDPATGELAPGLAESWEMSDDGLTYTFHLRDDVNWVRHNPATGETLALRPVVADDFVYALRRACAPQTASPYFTSIFIVDGCQVLYRGDPDFITEAFVAERLGVRAIDPHTVEYRLLFPAAYFLSFTAMPEFRPLPREHVEVPTAWAEQGSIVTNGPFVVEGWVHSHYLNLARNPHWPDDFTGNVARVEISFSLSSEAALRDLNAGQLDQLNAYGGGPGSVPAYDLRPSVVMLGFSAERAPVDKRGVRQAFAWAIDRASLAYWIREGAAITHLTPTGMVAGPPYDGVGQGYDPDAARQALANAGHANCQAIPEQIEIMVDDSERSQAIAQFVVENWQRELGCNPGLFSINPVSARTVRDNARDTYSSDYDYQRPHVWLISWTADYFDANNWFFDALHCRYGAFRTTPGCDETDALIETAGVQYDPAARASMYLDLEDRLFGVAGKYPVAPLYVAAQPVIRKAYLSVPGSDTTAPTRYDMWVIDTAVRGN